MSNAIDTRKLTVSCFCVEDDEIWFIDGIFNVLMKASIKIGKAEFVARIPNVKFVHEENFYESFSAIYKKENDIFLIPYKSALIKIFHIDKGKFTTIELNNAKKFKNLGMFGEIYEYEEYLYCFPYRYDWIIRISFKTLEVEYLQDIFNGRNNMFKDKTKLICPTGTVVDKIYYSTVYNTNILLKYDLKSNHIEYICMGSENKNYVGISYVNEQFYIHNEIPGVLEVQVYNKKFEYQKKIVLEEKMSQEFYRQKQLSNEIFCFESYLTGKLLMFDEKVQIITKKEYDFLEKCRYGEQKYILGVVHNRKNAMLYFSNIDKSMYEIKNKKLKYKFSLTISYDECKKIMNGLKRQDIMLQRENNVLGVRCFIAMLDSKDIYDVAKEDNVNGKVIYEITG